MPRDQTNYCFCVVERRMLRVSKRNVSACFRVFRIGTHCDEFLSLDAWDIRHRVNHEFLSEGLRRSLGGVPYHRKIEPCNIVADHRVSLSYVFVKRLNTLNLRVSEMVYYILSDTSDPGNFLGYKDTVRAHEKRCALKNSFAPSRIQRGTDLNDAIIVKV